MSLKTSYTLLAPFYDFAVRPFVARARERSLARLPREAAGAVLLNGAGTGLDLPFLPPLHRYVALDLTRAMLRRGRERTGQLDLAWVQGTSLALPFPDAVFDAAVLHLILAVVPDPARALAETARVLKPGGQILVLDKFLRRGERALLRRLVNPIAARVATRTDVVFEEVLAAVPSLSVASDEPEMAGGWFRRIILRKAHVR